MVKSSVGSYCNRKVHLVHFFCVMCVLWLALYCLSWRLGLFVNEIEVFVQVLVQESLVQETYTRPMN